MPKARRGSRPMGDERRIGFDILCGLFEDIPEDKISAAAESGTELGVGFAIGYSKRLEMWGTLMTEARWTVLVETKRADGRTERIEIASLERNVSSPTPDDLGLRLAEAKELLLRLQSFLAQDHVRQVSAVDRTCHCGFKPPIARLPHSPGRHAVRPSRPAAAAMAIMRMRSL